MLARALPPERAQAGILPGLRLLVETVLGEEELEEGLPDLALEEVGLGKVEARAILDSQAQWLNAHPNARITIEGHCDERGTREYNLALGDRRANAAKNYLAARGISPTRITTISYGKERPIALGSDEGSWAQNRRAVTIVIS